MGYTYVNKCVCCLCGTPGSLDILYLYLLNLATLTGKPVEKGISGEIQHICLKCAGGRDWKERSRLDPLLERTAMMFMSI